MSFYLCFILGLTVTVCESKIQLKKAYWTPLFNSILAEVKFPVILIIKINKEFVVKHVNNCTPLKIYVHPLGEAFLTG